MVREIKTVTAMGTVAGGSTPIGGRDGGVWIQWPSIRRGSLRGKERSKKDLNGVCGISAVSTCSGGTHGGIGGRNPRGSEGGLCSKDGGESELSGG